MAFRYLYSVLLLALISTLSCQKAPEPSVQTREIFLSDLDSLIGQNALFLQLASGSASKPDLRQAFLRLRLTYKKTEAFAEYFTPSTIRLVNGAPLDEVEDEENAVFEPGGLQVIEELIYTDEPLETTELIRQIRKMQVNLKRIRTLWADLQITDAQVLDALRLELFRLITLGISGFDTPSSANAVAESRAVMVALRSYVGAYQADLPGSDTLTLSINQALRFLERPVSFVDFDRASFIVDHINPICRLLNNAHKKSGIPFTQDGRLLRSDAATLFDPNAFNADAVLTNAEFRTSPEKVALGRQLFFDSRLSGAGSTHCGTCHQPALAYTDGLKTSKALGGGNVKRNAPSILYASLQQSLFYDLRSPTLEDQAADVIGNTEEMHGSVVNAARLIAADPEYLKDFKKAFPKLESVRPVHIQNALAAFVRSQSSFNSPFDLYMRGDKTMLTDDQVKGLNLFMGKAKCGTCHFVPLFNGTVPPDYQRTESEVLGVTSHADWKKPTLDPDQGRGAFNQFSQWRNAFKTSTLRNIARSAPYMHNGAYGSLQLVMEFYNEGGGGGLGLDVPNQTLATDKLDLTQREIEQVITFMESLSDR